MTVRNILCDVCIMLCTIFFRFFEYLMPKDLTTPRSVSNAVFHFYTRCCELRSANTQSGARELLNNYDRVQITLFFNFNNIPMACVCVLLKHLRYYNIIIMMQYVNIITKLC